MNFAPTIRTDARRAQRRETCLGVRPGEQVALDSDAASRAVAASIAPRWTDRRAPYNRIAAGRLGPRPMSAAPTPVLNALGNSDVA